MHILVKFTNYADDFQDGNLYMNTLNYFWNHGFEEQRDILEGLSSTIPIDLSSIRVPEMEKYMITDYYLRAEGFKYCNVMCMNAIDIILNGRSCSFNISKNMVEFGKYAIIINDEVEFLKRINRTANKYKYLFGKVKYHTPEKNGILMENKHHLIIKGDKLFDINNFNTKEKRGSFDKSIKYKYQNEWRLCIYRGEKRIDHFTLPIGDIRDISTRIKSKDMEAQIDTLIKNVKFTQSKENDYGNAGRDELRTLFQELGDNKATLFFTIG